MNKEQADKEHSERMERLSRQMKREETDSMIEQLWLLAGFAFLGYLALRWLKIL